MPPSPPVASPIGPHPAARDAALEFAAPEAIRRRQAELLAKHIRHAARSPFYAARLAEAGIDPASIADAPASLEALPLTSKAELAADPEAFRAVEAGEIRDVCLTSATTGERATPLEQTAEDLARLAYNEARAFDTAGLRPGETLVVLAALDRCFMAGLAYYLGGLALGLRCVRAGAGSAAQHWQLLRELKPQALVGVPSFLCRVGEYGRRQGGDPAALGLRLALGIGEALRDADFHPLPPARRFEETWAAPLRSTYASTEIATSFCECPEARGGHLRPELAWVEVLDESGRPLPPGRAGEVVVTPLGVRGMPLLRFRTGDMAALHEEPCPCGRNTPRLGPVLGRRDQMMKYKGTTLFPGTLLCGLSAHEGVEGAWVELRRDGAGQDRVTVCVATIDASLGADTLLEEIRARARVAPELRLVPPEEYRRRCILPGKRKPVQFFDLRSETP